MDGRADAVNTLLGLIALVVANLPGSGVRISAGSLFVRPTFGLLGTVVLITPAANGDASATFPVPPSI